MFNSLTGIITEKLPQTLYLETNGIEWDVCMPDSSLNNLPCVGSEARVYTWMYHKEDLMKLYGFATANDRAVFLDLLKVDGVGPKGAIKILSNISSKDLASALDGEDINRIEKVPGVGKKTAQKMMLTLKGKLTLSDEIVYVRKADSKWQDVINALINMGYEKKRIEDVIANLENSSEVTSCSTQTQKEELLFRKAIVELAQ